MKITRKHLRQIIKEELSRIVEEAPKTAKTDWDKILPTGIVKYDQGKKKRDAVEVIQKALKALAADGRTWDPGTADGRYGNKTVKSIKYFQTKTQGLKPDGDYGPNTRKAMIAAFNKAKEEEDEEAEEEEEEEEEEAPQEKPQCPPQWADNGNTLWGVNMNMLKISRQQFLTYNMYDGPGKGGTTIKDVYDKMDGGMQHALSTITKRVHCWHGDPNKERPVPTGKWITYFRTKEDWKKYKKQAEITKRKDGILTKKQQSKIKSEWGNVQFYSLSDNGVQYIVAMQFKNYKTPAKTKPTTPKNRSVSKAD